MAVLAYLAAPWSLRVIVERRWRWWPAMLVATWFTVDGCYWIYWSIKNPVALDLMRSANWPASLSLYAMCGLVWYYRGSLRDALKAVVDGLNDVLPTKHGADALTALRERFAALVQRDQSIPCRAALDAVQAYQQKANPDEIDTALRTYAAFVQKEYALAEKHATRRTPRN